MHIAKWDFSAFYFLSNFNAVIFIDNLLTIENMLFYFLKYQNSKIFYIWKATLNFLFNFEVYIFSLNLLRWELVVCWRISPFYFSCKTIILIGYWWTIKKKKCPNTKVLHVWNVFSSNFFLWIDCAMSFW